MTRRRKSIGEINAQAGALMASATGARYRRVQEIAQRYTSNASSYLSSVSWPRRANVRVPREVYTRNAEQRRRFGTGVSPLGNSNG